MSFCLFLTYSKLQTETELRTHHYDSRHSSSSSSSPIHLRSTVKLWIPRTTASYSEALNTRIWCEFRITSVLTRVVNNRMCSLTEFWIGCWTLYLRQQSPDRPSPAVKFLTEMRQKFQVARIWTNCIRYIWNQWNQPRKVPMKEMRKIHHCFNDSKTNATKLQVDKGAVNCLHRTHIELT